MGSGVSWPVMLREHAANDIFVDVDAEGMRNLLGDAYTAELGVAALQLDDRRDEFCRGLSLRSRLSVRLNFGPRGADESGSVGC